MALSSRELEPREMLDHLKAVIASERFLRMESLNNEVPFFICPYSIERHREIQEIYRLLSNQLVDQGIRVLEIDLFKLTHTILQDRGIWGQVLEAERTSTKAELLELLQAVLDPQEHLITASEANLNLPQLRNYLFRLQPLAHISAPYLKPVLTQTTDHFAGSRPMGLRING
jgi:hypothetical protein